MPGKFQGVTIEDVARHAGVSTATVSRFLNHSDKIAPLTAARIQHAVSELGYQPGMAARVLAGGKTHALGLVVDEIKGEFFNPMLRGISAAAGEAGYELLINATAPGRRPAGFPLGEKNTDGLIVFTDSLPDKELRRMHQAGFPCVLLHRSAPAGLAMPCVTVENKRGARDMVDYLIEQRGYRRIAFLRGAEGHEDSSWRERGYREALESHGLPYDEKLIGNGFFDEQQARETVTGWIRRGLKMEVIFAADDDSAIGAMLAVKEAGLRVPQDIAIVGFDDIRLARYLSPPLTTVRAPIEKAARLAVEQLVRLIETGSADPLTLLPTELIIRESCGFA
ncbi:MAG: LacI family transcriptional regulator [Anaerolineae bacterium]|nr:LacI family transcriptional regulator [Anaerolineae bacterium]